MAEQPAAGAARPLTDEQQWEALRAAPGAWRYIPAWIRSMKRVDNLLAEFTPEVGDLPGFGRAPHWETATWGTPSYDGIVAYIKPFAKPGVKLMPEEEGKKLVADVYARLQLWLRSRVDRVLGGAAGAGYLRDTTFPLAYMRAMDMALRWVDGIVNVLIGGYDPLHKTIAALRAAAHLSVLSHIWDTAAAIGEALLDVSAQGQAMAYIHANAREAMAEFRFATHVDPRWTMRLGTCVFAAQVLMRPLDNPKYDNRVLQRYFTLNDTNADVPSALLYAQAYVNIGLEPRGDFMATLPPPDGGGGEWYLTEKEWHVLSPKDRPHHALRQWSPHIRRILTAWIQGLGALYQARRIRTRFYELVVSEQRALRAAGITRFEPRVPIEFVGPEPMTPPPLVEPITPPEGPTRPYRPVGPLSVAEMLQRGSVGLAHDDYNKYIEHLEWHDGFTMFLRIVEEWQGDDLGPEQPDLERRTGLLVPKEFRTFLREDVRGLRVFHTNLTRSLDVWNRTAMPLLRTESASKIVDPVRDIPLRKAILRYHERRQPWHTDWNAAEAAKRWEAEKVTAMYDAAIRWRDTVKRRIAEIEAIEG